MCIAFQRAAAPRLPVAASVGSPSEARWELIAPTRSEAPRGTPHVSPATQSPTALAPARGTNEDDAALTSAVAARASAAIGATRSAIRRGGRGGGRGGGGGGGLTRGAG